MGPCVVCCAGERGLEPLITGPEPVVLPITPLPTEWSGDCNRCDQGGDIPQRRLGKVVHFVPREAPAAPPGRDREARLAVGVVHGLVLVALAVELEEDAE